MDARNTILEARRYLLCLSINGKDIQMIFKEIRAIIDELYIISHTPAYLKPIVKTYSLEEAEEDGLLGAYFRMEDKDGNDYIRYYENENTSNYITAEVPGFQFIEKEDGIDIVNPMASQPEEVRNEYRELIDRLICGLYYVTLKLKRLYSINQASKKSDRRRNRPIKVTPFVDLLAPNYKSEIIPIRRAIEGLLNGADEKEVARIMNMLFSLKIIRFPEKEIPCTTYMRTFQHEFNANVSDDKKCVANFRYHLAKYHNDALIKTQEISIEEPYKTIYSRLCALK